MNERTPDPISRLSIPPEKKSRKGGSWIPLWIVLAIILILIGILKLRQPGSAEPDSTVATAPPPSTTRPESTPPPVPETDSPVALTVSGYIVPRERIELTAKFPATVKVIHVKEGDEVKRGDVLVEMVDSTFQAKVREARGRLALAEAHRSQAETNHHRQLRLTETGSGTKQELDDAVSALDVARAEVQIAEGQLSLAETHLSWCLIRSPIDGTVLERLADADEVVIPQGYGGPDQPVTTLVSVADLTDLEVEVNVSEQDTPKVHRGQKCRVAPVAYPDVVREGTVVRIAPEADRQKGTLQVKVRIDDPTPAFVPDLYAKVEFLKAPSDPGFR